MGDICGDNRFEIIAEAKSDLLEATNINDSPEEMAALDSFLFRCWQMGWLRQYETFEFCAGGEQPCKEYDQEKHCCHRWTKVIRQTVEEMRSQQSEQKRTFLEIDVSYPTICTYQEYEGKPYYAIKYLEDGETIVGFGTYKPDVLSEYLRKYFIQFADTKRTAKVVDHEYRIGTSLNIVGEPKIFHEYLCGACKRKVLSGDDYCSHCGAKLIWEEENDF